MNTESDELSSDELYQRELWGRKMDKHQGNPFSPNWWSSIMQTVMAGGILAVFGLLLSMKSDINSLMRDFPYVSKLEYKDDRKYMDERISIIEHEIQQQRRAP